MAQLPTSEPALDLRPRWPGTTGLAHTPLPRLEIDGIGTVSFPVPQQRPDRGQMVALLSTLGDARLLEQFVRGVLTEHFDGSEAPAIAAITRPGA